ncbi:MAG TPA: ABC transporter permease [Candidatus Cybelea sp.]|nr:ABC transporter permease [Candidatus Cybelea sp.]
MMHSFIKDLRHGVRVLAKNPGFAAVAILTLGLGIGANTAIFTVVNGALLRPLPFRDSSSLVLVLEHNSSFPSIVSTSYQNYKDWRDQSRSLLSMEASCATSITLTGTGDPERLPAQRMTDGIFPLLGVTPIAGRSFLPEEDSPHGAPVAMISYALWQRRFGGSRNSIGRTIDLDSKPYTLVGVLPPGFLYLQPADVFIPFEPWAKTLPDDRNWHPGIIPVARLKPGVTIDEARAEMKTITRRLEKQYPLYNTGTSADVFPLRDRIVQNIRPALLVLLCSVGFILAIACTNVANLLLARAASRSKEIAIRTALGASPARVVRQLLAESVLIGFSGGALGLLIGNLSLSPLLKLAATTIPRMIPIHLDGHVLVFAAAVSVLASIFFGLIPALGTARLDLREALSESPRGVAGDRGGERLRSILVVSEIALAMVLLVGAGLLLRSFSRLEEVSCGFAPDHLLAADIPLSPAQYQKPQRKFEFFDRLLARVHSLPGVRMSGAASFLPMSGSGSVIHFNIHGRPPRNAHEFVSAGYRTITPRYLETLGVPLLAGRTITDADTENAPPVVVINAFMAHEFWGNESPLGKKMQLGGLPDDQVPWMQIVGVVGNVRLGLGVEPQAEMYLPYRQADGVLPVFQLSVLLRTALDPQVEASALRAAVEDVDPNQPLANLRTMDDVMASSVSEPRFRTWLLGLFALLAVALATIGIYGVIAYSVDQRRHELGIRLAMGAQANQMFRLVTGWALGLALAGVAIGAAISLGLTHVLRSFLYQTSALDPLTFLCVGAVLIGVAVLAAFLPARRATRVDPLVALRYE